VAIAIDKASIGTNATGSGITIGLTTNQTVAASGFIVLSLGWFTAVTLSSVAGGGLSWSIDKQGLGSGGNRNAGIVSAQAPSGLASGTTITATFSSSATVPQIGGTSFTGVKTSSPVDTTSGPTDQDPAATGWTSASTAISAGSVLIATCWNETSPVTSTVTAPSLEALDWVNGADTAETTAYRIEASAGSYTVAGTWSGSVKSTTVAVAYLAAAGADTGLAWIVA